MQGTCGYDMQGTYIRKGGARCIRVRDCKHVAYYSPPNVHIYSLLAEQLCCSVMSLLV